MAARPHYLRLLEAGFMPEEALSIMQEEPQLARRSTHFHVGPFGGMGEAAGYQIARSLRFNDDDSAYLTRTPGGAGNMDAVALSFWVKRFSLGAQTLLIARASGATVFTEIGFDSSDRLDWSDLSNSGVPSYYSHLVTTRRFRDTTAWCHIVIVYDSANATAADRVRIYVNGVRETAFDTASYPSSGQDCKLNDAVATDIGRRRNGADAGGSYFDGYLADIHLVGGSASLTASDFGETDSATGAWKPKTFAGSYGTNGGKWNFSDNSNTTAATLGADSSGNGNNFTPNNFSVTAGTGNDSLTDTPTNYGTHSGAGAEVRGDFCTLSAIDVALAMGSTGPTIANGGLQWVSGGSTRHSVRGTFPLGQDKYYCELTLGTTGADAFYGIANCNYSLNSGGFESAGVDSGGNALAINTVNGNKCSTTSAAYGSAYANGDVLMMAIDVPNAKIWWGKNGTWFASGDPAAGTNAAFTSLPSGTLLLLVEPAGGSANIWLNSGQRAYAHTAPTGFKSMCTQNLADSAVQKPPSAFDAKLRTGTGSAMSDTGLAFQPDLAGIKSRSAATDWAFYDAQRGVQKRLETNNTDAEVTSDDGLTAFNSDGATFGALAQVNTNTATYVDWFWREGATYGFDIVLYTGDGGGTQAVNHGNGSTPGFIAGKSRSAGASAAAWRIWHSTLGTSPSTTLYFDTSAASADSDKISAVSSTTFTAAGNMNQNTVTFVAYVWSPIAGFSNFGSYTGNNAVLGPLAPTGFRPALFGLKRTDSTGAWMTWDNKRLGYNVNNNDVRLNSTDTEQTDDVLDFLATGIKIRNNGSTWYNASGGAYVFWSFANDNLKNARAA